MSERERGGARAEREREREVVSERDMCETCVVVVAGVVGKLAGATLADGADVVVRAAGGQFFLFFLLVEGAGASEREREQRVRVTGGSERARGRSQREGGARDVIRNRFPLGCNHNNNNNGNNRALPFFVSKPNLKLNQDTKFGHFHTKRI